jgi:hypothetical protein
MLCPGTCHEEEATDGAHLLWYYQICLHQAHSAEEAEQ